MKKLLFAAVMASVEVVLTQEHPSEPHEGGMA
jgi:hypothetical protein